MIKKYEPGYEIYLPALVQYFNVETEESGHLEWGCSLNFQQIFYNNIWN